MEARMQDAKGGVIIAGDGYHSGIWKDSIVPPDKYSVLGYARSNQNPTAIF